MEVGTRVILQVDKVYPAGSQGNVTAVHDSNDTIDVLLDTDNQGVAIAPPFPDLGAPEDHYGPV